MILSEMRTRLRKRIGNPDTTDVPNSDLTENINDAYRDLSNRFRFHKTRKLCQFPTVDGTGQYGFPTDLEVLLRARDLTNGIKLKKMDDDDLAKLEPEAQGVTGKPTHYIRVRNFIQLYPQPNDAFVIELFYIAGIADLSADGDEPVIPLPWHEGIIKLARHYYYDGKGDTPKAQYALGIYQSWLSTKPIEVDQEKADLDKGVRIPTLARPGRAGRLSFDEE